MSSGASAKSEPYYWLIYLAALLAGLLLIADAISFRPIAKITARLGIGLLYTAFAFIVGGARASAIIGTILLWLAVLITIFV
ncbi:MAG: hypothetical protein AB1772_03790 [Candidatus Zixiibacteriota bacterium]